jgi:MFS family permease
VRLARRIADARMLQPLRRRDFALLTGGRVVSLFGDGFYYLALTWQVYTISNVPAALAIVGAAATLPVVLFLLLGGAFSDRHDRRRVMVAADLLRAAAVGTMAVLSMSGILELWHIAALVAMVGIGDAFFNPASTAIVPELVVEGELPAANALDGMYRSLMTRLLGPAIGGVLVGAMGPAPALGINAASFIVSAIAIWRIRSRPMARRPSGHGFREMLSEVGEGVRFARSIPWIWATLLAAMFSLLVFIGPMEVLVPYLVKNRLNLGPEALGLIFAVGGVGSIGMSLVVGSAGLPRRRVTVMYGSWTVGVALTALFGVMTALWQAVVISFVLQAAFQLGQVIWTTMLQQLVPRDLLGRVSSLDWLVSTALVPLSFALTGPVSDVLGPETTIVVAGLLGAVLMSLMFFVPGVRDPERPAANLTIQMAGGRSE